MDHISTADISLFIAFVGQLVVVAFFTGGLAQRVNSLEEKAKSVADTPKDIEGLKARIAGLEEDRALAKDLMSTLSALAEKVSGLSDRFGSLERKVEQIATREAA